MSEVSEGRKLENLGYESLQKNNIKEAESSFLAALKEMEKEGDETGQAYVLGNLGNISFQSKQFDKAEEYAIEGSRAYGRVVPAWLNLNFIYLLEGKGPSMVDAFKGLYRAQMAEEPHLRSQRQQDVEVILAQILLLGGEINDSIK